MAKQVFVRLILGIIFAMLGFGISERIVPDDTFLFIPHIYQYIVGFMLGLIGVFLVPMISSAFATGAGRLSEMVAREVVKQTKLFSELRAKRIKGKPKKGKNLDEINFLIVDTSCLIDGRIVDIARTGFVNGTLLILKDVVSELRHVADSSDLLRRQRGRKGLEVLEELKKVHKSLKIVLVNEEFAGKEVDEKLVFMAKKYKGRILTVDFNLNKAAKVSGIESLNVNELANAVKTIVLPGEEMSIKIIQTGKEEGQGVAYLPDGTMIVVENGKDLIGSEVLILISRVIQTPAGRIIFAKRK